jgi:predicted enzyme related to lactoylglutathione lyase
MSVYIGNIAFDCADPYALAEFWSMVTACPIATGDKPGDKEVDVPLGQGMNLVFIRVPEPKAGKNRVHVCLRPDGDRDAEVDRVLSLGARLVADRRRKSGTGWVVFADPEGNEFCLLRAAAGARGREL